MGLLKFFLIILAIVVTSPEVIAQEFVYKKKLGKFVFKPKKGKVDPLYSFDSIEYLSSGIWIVNNNELCGVFSKEEKLLLPTIFEKIDHFTNKGSLVKLQGEWGTYIDGNFNPSADEVIFQNPDQIAHLSRCESTGTSNKSYDDCLFNEIYMNLRYPKDAVTNEIEGIIVAEFIIDSLGGISSMQIVRGLGGGINEEFTRLVNENLDHWLPARNDGRPVKSRKIIATRMKLKG